MSERRAEPDANPGEDWFAEAPRSGFRQAAQVRSRVWSGCSGLQRIDIVDTVPFGRALVLDDAIQTTEADEFCYHELLVHIPLVCHPSPRRVLIVGGGDGGCLRHVLMHDLVETVVQVEIDATVVRACQEWLPALAEDAFHDPRAELLIGDGVAFLRDVSEPFDVILVDSTDPIGPAAELVSKEFFGLAREALAPNGLLVTQSGSPLLMHAELRIAVERMRSIFPIAAVYLGYVPSYPGVVWSFTVGSNRLDPSQPCRTAPPGCRYYTRDVHRGAFALPQYLAASLNGGVANVRSASGPVLG